MTVRLRPWVEADTPALAEIFVAAFQDGYPDVLPADVLAGVQVRTVGGWFARWTSELTTVVAERDGAPAGFVRFGDDTEIGEPDVGYIAALYVSPSAAGAGIGRRLVEHALSALAARGRTAVTLWVFRENARARSLYARAGFAPTGDEVTDPQWRAPQIRMRRELTGSG